MYYNINQFSATTEFASFNHASIIPQNNLQ